MTMSSFYCYYLIDFIADCTTCDISMLVVTEPTPPGTGDIAEIIGSTAEKSTSPHSLPDSST